MEREPQAHHWTMPLMAFAILETWALLQPTANLWVAVVMAIGGVFLVWAIVNLFIHVDHTHKEERRMSREIEFRFHPNYLAETISKMNDGQLRAIRLGRHIVEVIPGQNGRVDKLFGVECYLYTAWYILVHSNEMTVYPIRQFQTSTYHFDVLGDMSVDDQQQAKNFHVWLNAMDYAEWGRGNISMSWKTGFNPNKLLEMLGMDRETFDD